MSGNRIEGLVSVIIPAYNHEEFIEEAIDSVILQSYDNIELIIINDGSKDNTSTIIKSKEADCKARFANFIFVDKKNEGVIKTLNAGLKLSKGEFVALCASDDKYAKDAIETLHKALHKKKEYVLAVGDNYVMDERGASCYLTDNGDIAHKQAESVYKTFGLYLQKERKDIDFGSKSFGSYRSFLKGNYIPNGYLIRSDVFIDVIGGYQEEASLEDYNMHLQLSKHGKYHYVDKPLFYYRKHQNNTISDTQKMFRITMQTFSLEKEYAYKNGFKEDFDKSHFYSRSRLVKIPYIFEYQTIRSVAYKLISITLFGITLLRKEKIDGIKSLEIFNIKFNKY